MPEVILPCPACGAVENEGDKFALSYRLGVQIICHKCGMYGPVADDFHEAVKRWNALPRSLTWTHEPPKVEGWYYVRQREDIDKPWSKPRIVSIKTLTIAPSEYWQFAGPIPAPID